MAAEMAVRRHTVPVRWAKGNRSARFSRVEPAIQNGITRPKRTARAERMRMCVSRGWRLSAGWAKAATFSSLPHMSPRIKMEMI